KKLLRVQEQTEEEERVHREEEEEEEERFRKQKQQDEERLYREQQEEEERLRREHQEEKLRREQREEDEKQRRMQLHEEEERLYRKYHEEMLFREQNDDERYHRELQLLHEARVCKEKQLEEERLCRERQELFFSEKEQVEDSLHREQQRHYKDQLEERLHREKYIHKEAFPSYAESDIQAKKQHLEYETDELYDTLPVNPPAWGAPPLSPSRPKSPWGKLDPYEPFEDDKEYVGFATLPNQVHRKYVKKGFEFTLMVAGESGLGKSTLINSLFLMDLYQGRQLPSPEECVTQTVEIVKQTVDIQEKGVRLRLTVIDTPGYGEAINNEHCWKPIADYIDQQFEQYFRDESGLNRRNLQDTRVHCCLYFLSPLGHGMRPLDIEVLRALQDRVNIVPILGKADSLTPRELQQKKQRIREELDHFGIRIYQFPECDSDQDEDFKQQDMELKRSIPFAVIGSNTVVESNGKRVRGRQYPWGVVEVENEQHCDFVKLRTMLIRTHMQDLKDVTRETHYENYRAQCIQSLTQRVVRERNRNKLTRESGTDFPIPSVPPSPDHDTQRLIREKDEELRRMQEVLQNMQRQMKDSH
ncbi:septin-4-like, partial [Bombina bombina]|uniref:septin-4-like n=1 Tax=Bombina bombina TaxID=8345 RepID=UPI00235B0906